MKLQVGVHHLVLQIKLGLEDSDTSSMAYLLFKLGFQLEKQTKSRTIRITSGSRTGHLR